MASTASTIIKTPLTLPPIRIDDIDFSVANGFSPSLQERVSFITANFIVFFNPYDSKKQICPLKGEIGGRRVCYLHATQIVETSASSGKPETTIELHMALFAKDTPDIRATFQKVIQAVISLFSSDTSNLPKLNSIRAFRIRVPSETGIIDPIKNFCSFSVSSNPPSNLQWKYVKREYTYSEVINTFESPLH